MREQHCLLEYKTIKFKISATIMIKSQIFQILFTFEDNLVELITFGDKLLNINDRYNIPSILLFQIRIQIVQFYQSSVYDFDNLFGLQADGLNLENKFILFILLIFIYTNEDIIDETSLFGRTLHFITHFSIKTQSYYNLKLYLIDYLIQTKNIFYSYYRNIIILKSTMKIPKGSKKGKNKSKPNHLQQQIDSDNLLSDVQQEHPNANNFIQQDFRTPEQVKISIAKKLIQKTKNSINKKKQNLTSNRVSHDDFFLAEDGQALKKPNNFDRGSRLTQQEQLAEQLKNQYLKSKNKLFTDLQNQFESMKIDEPISYKGHTKCITAIQLTEDKIFSVSKDRSIIVWDREKGTKDFITMAKQQTRNQDHEGPILCMSYHPMQRMIATAGDDGKIKLWDVRSNSLIDTMKGHRNTVNGIKFGFNSNNLCSVSSDRTMKQWDCAQRGIIQTYYGHNFEILDIDCINDADFVSSGNDHQNIVWKTQKETQVIFEGHEYAIDRVRSINEQKFISGCQDGSIFLWSQKKKKPIYKHQNAHQSWIGALDCIRQSNIFASGGCDNIISIWSIGQELKNFKKIHEIKSKGIITDIKINKNEIAATVCDEHRLGRWLTTRVRNQIQVYKFRYE